MEYPEFRDLVKSWELPEEWAERMWGRFGHVLMHVTAADVEPAGVVYWRRRARFWRALCFLLPALCFLLLVILLLLVRK